MYDFNARGHPFAVSRLLAVGHRSSSPRGWSRSQTPSSTCIRGGRFSPRRTPTLTARYFAHLRAFRSRCGQPRESTHSAFYAARNTLVPAISGTVVTIVSIPIYALLFHRMGVDGLAIASDLGILTHTLALAILLHKFRLVSIACLDYAELARATIAATAAFGAVILFQHLQLLGTSRGYIPDLILITLSSLVWAAIAFAILRLTGSKLPQQLRRR